MFSQVSVILSTEGGVHGKGHVWCGACMAGGKHGRGYTWQGACMAGVCMAGDVCGVARGCVESGQGGGCAWQGTCVVGAVCGGRCVW